MGSLAGRAGAAPKPVALPELTQWRAARRHPRRAPGFDDSSWTVADHLDGRPPARSPAACPCWPPTSTATTTATSGTAAGSAPRAGDRARRSPRHRPRPGSRRGWLNGRYLGSAGDRRAHQFDIPGRAAARRRRTTSSPCSSRTWATTRSGDTTTRRSRAGWSRRHWSAVPLTVTWRIQGNRGGEKLLDPARGPAATTAACSASGPAGPWPGYPDGELVRAPLPARETGRPASALVPHDVRARPAAGQDTASACRSTTPRARTTAPPLRQRLAWSASYVNDVGPQHELRHPARACCDEHGTTPSRIAVWSTERRRAREP